jgi:hypothetical protein
MVNNFVCLNNYNFDFLKPSFSNTHFEGQNLVQTPTCNIVITNNITYQFFETNPNKRTNDIKK